MKTLSKVIKKISTPLVITLLALMGLAQISLAQTTTVTYLHHDALGSVVAASNEDGELLWRKSYKPYGAQIEGSDTEEKVSYTGHSFDKDLDLTYMKARYFDQELGRFMSIDPAGVLGHIESNTKMFNRYAYGNNNPFSFVDPDGEQAIRGTRLGKSAAGDSAGIPMMIGYILTKMNPKGSSAHALGESMLAEGRKMMGTGGRGGKAKAPPPKWKGPTDYSSIPDPKNLVNTKPTPRQVREMKRLNREHNDGELRSDMDGTVLVDSKKSVKGVTPPPNEAQIDHKDAVANGGTRNNGNLQILSRKQNREKSDK